MPKPKPDRSTKKVQPPTDATESEPSPRLSFPVVGLGASAGGLESFIEVIKALPADSEMAFVLVQHLPPEANDLTAEILSAHTTMPVLPVTDGTEVEPNHVYVIRPGYTMTMREGRLHLGEPVEKPGHRRPIDDFFRSLAEEQRERAICVILSGTGSNGTAGAQTIKAAGGLCIAQDPATARSSGMPSALIEAGLADFVLRPAEISDALVRYGRHPCVRGVALENSERERQAFGTLLSLLRTRLHHDFSGYRKPTMHRRIQRRMGVNKITAFDDYVRFLGQSPAEIAALADDLMIHVTGFFRDSAVWKSLGEKFIAPLMAARESGGSIRAWVAACSTGEEAYTLAILLVEAAEAAGKAFDMKIFATDTAERSLAHARAGVFPGGIESEVSPERLARFFEHEGTGYRVKKKLRELVVFAPQNLLQDPPYSRLDICTCRNLLIYLEPEVQRRALQLMHFSLRQNGVLVLGSSESVAGLDGLFEPIEKKQKLFRRLGAARHGAVDFPLPRLSADSTGTGGSGLPKSGIGPLAERALLSRFTPPSVVIDQERNIVHFHGQIERYLDHPRGAPTRELLPLVRESFAGAVRSAVHTAFAEGRTASARTSWIDSPTGRWCVEVIVSKLEVKDAARNYLVSFVAVTASLPATGQPAPGSEENRTRMEAELKRVGDELRSTIGELQDSNEELRAANEETTSVNEELQSTNEELETSKEELQSLNEELTSVNSQLQLKMEELEGVTSDLVSLLTNTEIAVVFLDLKLNIRRFTPSISDLLDLIPSDAGRPLAALAQKFSDPDFIGDAGRVATTQERVEKEVTSHGGRIYLRRTLPYWTNERRADGVVITFVDITELKRAEESLRVNEQRYRLSLEGIKDYAIFLLDADGRIVSWPAGAQRMFSYTPAEAMGRPSAFLFAPKERTSGLPESELVRARAVHSVAGEHLHVRKDGSQFWGDSMVAALFTADGQIDGFIRVLRDVTEQRRTSEALKQAKGDAEAANAAKDDFLAMVSHELRTPLTPMLLWAQILDREDMPTRGLLHEGLETIRKCVEEQHVLIEDLVDTTRIVTGKMRIEPKPTDLVLLAQTAIDLARPAAVFKGVELESSLDPAAGTVLADPGRLQQVLTNLLNNAVKFTPAGGRVSLELRRDRDTVEIRVSDNGIGIAAEFLPLVFNRFGQLDDSSTRVASGLGLGLWIARQLVELHHGTITAHSEGPDRGATFVVKLPLAIVKLGNAASDESTALRRVWTAALEGLHVLLVEDAEKSRAVLALALRSAGAAVTTVATGAAALEEFRRRRPGVILSDIGMPHMNGHEMIRKIREIEKTGSDPRVPAFALTAFSDEKNRRESEASGFDGYLTKPVDYTQLLTTLESVKSAGRGKD